MRVLIVCDDASATDTLKDARAFEDTVYLNQYGVKPNLRQEITNVTHRVVGDLDPKARDLLDIASYVYAADGSVKRGTEKDVFAEKWKRDFTFALPVRDSSFWSSPKITGQLEETLSFLTGDSFRFFFSERKGIPEQLLFDFPSTPPPFPNADSLCLFSGGIDSLAGAVYLCLIEEKHPILVSHRSSPKLDSRQKHLVELLNDRLPDWMFPHLSMWINRIGSRAVESTQRSRSFLYLSIAVAVANQLNIGEIAICENGVLSFNLPKSGQNVGTFLSRTTHPRFLADFQLLADSVFSQKITILNPFIFKTKSEVVETLTGTGCEELVQESVSCVHVEGTTRMQPHCGTCSQCVDRRFSIAAAGYEKFDLPGLYAVDNNLFIEMKFLNRREKLNAIVTQISSRITIYHDQGAHVLFVVYDAADIISDDEKFVQDFEKHDGIYVVVIR